MKEHQNQHKLLLINDSGQPKSSVIHYLKKLYDITFVDGLSQVIETLDFCDPDYICLHESLTSTPKGVALCNDLPLLYSDTIIMAMVKSLHSIRNSYKHFTATDFIVCEEWEGSFIDLCMKVGYYNSYQKDGTIFDMESIYQTIEQCAHPLAFLNPLSAQILSCNDALKVFWGDVDSDALIGKGPLELAPKFQQSGIPTAFFCNRMVALAEERGFSSFKCQMQTDNRELRSVVVRLVSFRNGEDPVMLASFGGDDNDEKSFVNQTEEEFNNATLNVALSNIDLENMIRAVNQSKVSVVVTNVDGLIEYVNDSFSLLTGYAFSEVIGKNPRILKAPGAHPPSFYEKLWDAILSGKTWEGHICNKRKDGSLFWEETFISPVIGRSGDITHFIAIKNDITKLMEKDREIISFASFAKMTPAPVFRVSNEGVVLLVNPAAERILDFHSQMSENETPTWIMESIHEMQLNEMFEYQKEIFTKEEVYLFTFLFDPILDSFNVYGANITKIKATEQELLLAKKHAEDEAKAKSLFLANMSHEIRTPLNAIIGLTHLLGKTSMSLKQSEYQIKMLSSSRFLLGTINNVLDFSKIEAGALILENIEFDIRDLLRDVCDVNYVRAREKNLELIYSCSSVSHFHVLGDSLRISQILNNLISNAIKFTKRGSIFLETKIIQKEPVAIFKFSVTDTGIGIAEEKLSSLFESFTQADSSTTRKYGGTGLGLSISQKLVSLMGGEIMVKSEKGKGSTFSFTTQLPIVSEEHTIVQDQFYEMITSLNVLVVEDNIILTQVMEKMLAQIVQTLVIHNSCEEALAYIQNPDSESFDLIILDFSFPSAMNGSDFIDELRTLISKEKFPKIVLTSGESEHADTTIHCDAFLAKPFSYSDLFDALATALGRPAEEEPQKVNTLPLKGTRILLVEDNEINQEIGLEMLEQMGTFPTIAANGKVAVDILKDKHFDLVLMDIQMPVMDGVEATKQIREKLQLKELPILAMTANSTTTDRDAAFSAGMNSYITKPIDPDELEQELQCWLVADKHFKGNSVEKKNIAQNSFGLEPVAGLDYKNGLTHCANNSTLYMSLLEKFFKSGIEYLKEYERQLLLGKINEALREVHSLKAVAGNIGAENLFRAAEQLEQGLKSNNSVDIAYSYELIQVQFESLLADLEKVLVGNKPSEKSELKSNEEIHSIIVRLDELLEDGDSDAVSLIEELHNVTDNEILKNELTKLEDLIQKYDFDSAQALLKTINNKFL